MELKYQSFQNIQKKLKKIIFELFFRTRKLEKSVFGDQRSRVKFSKKSRKFANRPVEVGQVAETTPNKFFWLKSVCAIKMSPIPASHDHFWRSYVIAKLENFQRIFRKSHFGRFVNVCENGILASKNLGFWRNHFFASLFFGKCFSCSWLLEKKSFCKWKSFLKFLQHFEI